MLESLLSVILSFWKASTSSAVKTRGAPLHGRQRVALYWWRNSQNRAASKGRPLSGAPLVLTVEEVEAGGGWSGREAGMEDGRTEWEDGRGEKGPTEVERWRAGWFISLSSSYFFPLYRLSALHFEVSNACKFQMGHLLLDQFNYFFWILYWKRRILFLWTCLLWCLYSGASSKEIQNIVQHSLSFCCWTFWCRIWRQNIPTNRNR